ncbi:MULTISPECIES: hypothetical protein [Streptomyces]|uniref:hypothetical protein n=1 Tax=Streptomyces TaxID=1883 RepID=UPI00142DAD7C|nr:MULTISPECIES: hypothetical protein [Streptomyces]
MGPASGGPLAALAVNEWGTGIGVHPTDDVLGPFGLAVGTDSTCPARWAPFDA